MVGVLIGIVKGAGSADLPSHRTPGIEVAARRPSRPAATGSRMLRETPAFRSSPAKPGRTQAAASSGTGNGKDWQPAGEARRNGHAQLHGASGSNGAAVRKPEQIIPLGDEDMKDF